MHIQGQEPLTASMLAAAPPQEQKRMIGGCQGCSAGCAVVCVCDLHQGKLSC